MVVLLIGLIKKKIILIFIVLTIEDSVYKKWRIKSKGKGKSKRNVKWIKEALIQHNNTTQCHICKSYGIKRENAGVIQVS